MSPLRSPQPHARYRPQPLLMAEVIWALHDGKPGWLNPVTGRWVPAQRGLELHIGLPSPSVRLTESPRRPTR